MKLSLTKIANYSKGILIVEEYSQAFLGKISPLPT